MVRNVLLALLLTPLCLAAAELPKMKFGEVKEIAPGVFFRYSSISPTDPSVFGGSNHTWIVFEDYVVVIDANFPREAGDVLADIRKTTDKPVRYVLDTHHHGDHAWGNAVWIKAGATIIAHRNCNRLLRTTGPADFAAAGKGPNARKDVAASVLRMPTLIFDDKLVLDDGRQRVEFLQLGHSHTIGDAVAWLPRQGILCTGDACVNGAYNYMGQSSSSSWIQALERMQALDVKLVCPGHGLLAGKELLAKQKRYFAELRTQVKKGIDRGQDVDDIVKSIDMPWYKEWTTVPPAVDNIKHVYNEYMGLVAPWDFEYDLGILAGPSPTRESPDWKKPRRIVVPAGLSPGQLAQLKRAAAEVEFLPAASPEQAIRLAADADAVLGFASREIIQAGKNLRWLQAPPGGVTPELLAALRGKPLTLTDTQRIHGPQAAEQTFALLLSLTHNRLGKRAMPPVELRGKTLLVVGLGGTGEQVAQRARAFGMRVIAVDDQVKEKPESVDRLGKIRSLLETLPAADVVVLALPLTESTRQVLAEKHLKAMKKGAFLINPAHPGLVDLDALSRASHLAGVGLDTTGNPLPSGHPLRKAAQVVLTEHNGTPSAASLERQWRLYRENVRRFAAGEPLLSVVER